jgi:hypothetical protein
MTTDPTFSTGMTAEMKNQKCRKGMKTRGATPQQVRLGDAARPDMWGDYRQTERELLD